MFQCLFLSLLFGHSIAGKTHFGCIFKVSIFFVEIKEALELKIMIFENSSPKGILRQIMNNLPKYTYLFLSRYENIRVHTLCDLSVFISNSPVHTYPDSLRIDKIVPPGTGSSRSNPVSSRTALLSYSFKLFLPAVLSGR